METSIPSLEELKDLSIDSVGEAKIDSPLGLNDNAYVEDDNKILAYSQTSRIDEILKNSQSIPAFEKCGPRKKIFFNPAKTTCGIVTCGGLCPGLNDVIRSLTLALSWQYNVKKILGFQYGYEGMSSNKRSEPLELTPLTVDDIHHKGGTILGTSRGPQDVKDMVDNLIKYKVDILFAIGGDGTFNGAHEIYEEIARRRQSIAIVGIPKTIDNDIYCSMISFGFNTAVEEAASVIRDVHEEAHSAWNGIGLLKIMGRDSGFITANASLANSDVNFCLIPEVPFELEGKNGLLERLENRLQRKHHAVIAVAEGAGQNLIKSKEPARDPSGNIRYGDIGLFLKDKIESYLKLKNVPFSLKYVDPSYIIRSCPANAYDSAFCLMLSISAVHTAMAGKTNVFVGYWNHNFVHVPLRIAVKKRKRVDTCGVLWQTVLSVTE